MRPRPQSLLALVADFTSTWPQMTGSGSLRPENGAMISAQWREILQRTGMLEKFRQYRLPGDVVSPSAKKEQARGAQCVRSPVGGR